MQLNRTLYYRTNNNSQNYPDDEAHSLPKTNDGTKPY